MMLNHLFYRGNSAARMCKVMSPLEDLRISTFNADFCAFQKICVNFLKVSIEDFPDIRMESLRILFQVIYVDATIYFGVLVFGIKSEKWTASSSIVLDDPLDAVLMGGTNHYGKQPGEV